MTAPSAFWVPVGYAFGAALAASGLVMLVAAILLGFHTNEWAEWPGRWVGATATAAGILGAIVGLRAALRSRLPDLQ